MTGRIDLNVLKIDKLNEAQEISSEYKAYRSLSTRGQMQHIFDSIELECERMKKLPAHADSMWLFTLREYAVEDKDSGFVTEKDKDFYKSQLKRLTEKYPQLVVIGGTLAVKKRIDKSEIRNKERLIRRDYAGQAFFMSSHSDRDDEMVTHFEKAERVAKKRNKQEMFVVENVCYIAQGGRISKRLKSHPHEELEISTKDEESTVFRLGNATSKNPIIYLRHPTTKELIPVCVEICKEHAFAHGKRFATVEKQNEVKAQAEAEKKIEMRIKEDREELRSMDLSHRTLVIDVPRSLSASGPPSLPTPTISSHHTPPIRSISSGASASLPARSESADLPLSSPGILTIDVPKMIYPPETRTADLPKTEPEPTAVSSRIHTQSPPPAPTPASSSTSPPRPITPLLQIVLADRNKLILSHICGQFACNVDSILPPRLITASEVKEPMTAQVRLYTHDILKPGVEEKQTLIPPLYPFARYVIDEFNNEIKASTNPLVKEVLNKMKKEFEDTSSPIMASPFANVAISGLEFSIEIGQTEIEKLTESKDKHAEDARNQLIKIIKKFQVIHDEEFAINPDREDINSEERKIEPTSAPRRKL